MNHASFKFSHEGELNNSIIYILIAIILIFFIIEEYLGGSKNALTLLNLGANSKELVLQKNQYYRLITSMYLHAGLMHLFFNCYVLYSFGNFLFSILGNKNFLLVFFISGICGSLASVFLSKASISVGASGAIWGFLGATLALSVFPSYYIADYYRNILLKTTGINIAINLGISLLPMIDIWAHLGGGISGFILTWFIISEPKSYFRKTKHVIKNILLYILLALNLICLTYVLFINLYTKYLNY